MSLLFPPRHLGHHFPTRLITGILLRLMSAQANAAVLAGFLDYLRIEKGLARLSIAAYTTDINQFAEFLSKHKANPADGA